MIGSQSHQLRQHPSFQVRIHTCKVSRRHFELTKKSSFRPANVAATNIFNDLSLTHTHTPAVQEAQYIYCSIIWEVTNNLHKLQKFKWETNVGLGHYPNINQIKLIKLMFVRSFIQHMYSSLFFKGMNICVFINVQHVWVLLVQQECMVLEFAYIVLCYYTCILEMYLYFILSLTQCVRAQL